MSSGIGVFLAPNQSGQYLITKIVPGGPTDLTGQVRNGDILVQLGGQTLEGLSIEGVRNCILGPPGSFVDLAIQRFENGRPVLIPVTVQRGPAMSREPSPMRQPSPMPGSAPMMPGQRPMPGPAIGRPFAQHRPGGPPPPQLHPRARQQMGMQGGPHQGSAAPSNMSPGPQYGSMPPGPMQQNWYPGAPRSQSAFDPRRGPPDHESFNPDAPPPPRRIDDPNAPPPPRPQFRGGPGPYYPPGYGFGRGPRGMSVPPPQRPWGPQGPHGPGPMHMRQGPNMRASANDISPGPMRPGPGPYPQSAGPMMGMQGPGSMSLPGRPRPPHPQSVAPMQPQEGPGSEPGSARGPGPQMMGGGQGGLGLTLRNDVNGDLRVTEISPGGPAHQQGTLRRGDVITHIDGVNVRGWSVVQARQVIMGPAGSTVQVAVLRSPGQDPRQQLVGHFRINLVRGLVPASREFASAQNSPARTRPMPVPGSAGPLVVSSQPPMVGGPGGSPNFNMNGGPGPGEEGDDIESSHAPPPPGGRVSRSLDMEIARGVEGEMALASGPGPARGQVQVNEGMCGIGVFLGWSEEGLVSVKHVAPDGPAAELTDIQPGDYLVAIDGVSTESMPRKQVRDMIVGRRGTQVRLTLRRLLIDPNTRQGSLTPVFDVQITREPPGPASRAVGAQQQLDPSLTNLNPTPRPGPALVRHPGMPGSPTPPLHLQQPDTMPQRIITTPRPGQPGGPPAPAMMAPPPLPMPAPAPQQRAPEPDPPTDPPPPGMENRCSVGIDLIEFDGALIIQNVHPNRPAERSGLVVKGDLIHRIDYRTVSEMSLEEVLPLIEGPDKSSVVLGLIKPRYRLRVNVRLQREWIANSQNKVRAMPVNVNQAGNLKAAPPALLKPLAQTPQQQSIKEPIITPVEPPQLAPRNPHAQASPDLSPPHPSSYPRPPPRRSPPDAAAQYVTEVEDIGTQASASSLPPPSAVQSNSPILAPPPPPRPPIGSYDSLQRSPPTPPRTSGFRSIAAPEESALQYASGGGGGGADQFTSIPAGEGEQRPLPPGPDIVL